MNTKKRDGKEEKKRGKVGKKGEKREERKEKRNPGFSLSKIRPPAVPENPRSQSVSLPPPEKVVSLSRDLQLFSNKALSPEETSKESLASCNLRPL